MQIALGLLVSCCVAMAFAEGEVPECLDMTPEKLTQLKSMLVTEDVHDKMVGDYVDYWGHPSFSEGAEKVCVKYTLTKVDDTQLSLMLHTSGAWTEQNRNFTLVKLENGVYIMKNAEGVPVLREYQIAAKQNVRVHFDCSWNGPPAGSKEASVPHFTGVGVATHANKTPLEADVQEALDEVVKKVQEHKDIFGEIALFNRSC